MNTPKFKSIDDFPDWTKKMIPERGLERVWESWLLSKANEMGDYFGQPIQEDTIATLSANFIEALIQVGGADLTGRHYPSRVVEHVERQSDHSPTPEMMIKDCLNNFAFNTCPAIREQRVYQPWTYLPPAVRVLNHPNLACRTRGSFYTSFEAACKRHDLLIAVRASYDDQSWHTPQESNKLLVPVFLDLASMGWSIGFLRD